MLPAPCRLRLRRDFKRVYARGRSVAVPCFALYWRKGAAGRKRIGFSVSKKLGKAVERNRVKRRCRAAARELLHKTPAGYDFIFVARGAASLADYARLKADMTKALELMKQRIDQPPRRSTPSPANKGAKPAGLAPGGNGDAGNMS